MKPVMTREEQEYEKVKDELKFKPNITRLNLKKKEDAPQLKENKGMDKFMQRMAKAREEAQFKKAMTERSNFTAAQGVKKA